MKDLSISQKTHDSIRLNKDVSRVPAETIESALSPVGASAARLTSVKELSDRDLLAAADLRMDEAQGRRLGRLLDRQQSGKLSESRSFPTATCWRRLICAWTKRKVDGSGGCLTFNKRAS